VIAALLLVAGVVADTGVTIVVVIVLDAKIYYQREKDSCSRWYCGHEAIILIVIEIMNHNPCRVSWQCMIIMTLANK
jgi:hypothetical protein